MKICLNLMKIACFHSLVSVLNAIKLIMRNSHLPLQTHPGVDLIKLLLGVNLLTLF
jgi:hypothetical protein